MRGWLWTTAVTAVALLGGCRDRLTTVAESHVDPVRCAALQPADSIETSRAGFLQEVLDARATLRTPRFNDYHAGSYHVAKADLAAGLLEITRACGVRLTGAVVVGPVGPLWAYHVAAFLPEPDGRVRVNSLVMPHARITRKAAGVLPAAAADALLADLVASPLLSPGPILPGMQPDTSALGRDFRYDVLVFQLRGDSALVRSGALRDHPDTAAVRRFFERVNQVMGQLQPTYTHGQSSGRGDT